MSIKNRGVVATLWALILPGIFLFLTLVVQLSQEMNRRLQIEHLGYQAAQAGLLIVQNELDRVFQINKSLTCSVEFPPSVCQSSVVDDFVSDVEKADIITDTYLEVWERVREFIITHDPKSELVFSDIRMTYPYFPLDPVPFCSLGVKINIQNIEIESFQRF